MNEKYELTEEFKEIETLREGWLQDETKGEEENGI